MDYLGSQEEADTFSATVTGKCLKALENHFLTPFGCYAKSTLIKEMPQTACSFLPLSHEGLGHTFVCLFCYRSSPFQIRDDTAANQTPHDAQYLSRLCSANR
jgi:hypothetical protein